MTKDKILVVCSFPRAGSSLTMRLLHVGGCAVHCDNRTSYEHDDYHRLPGDYLWLPLKCMGKAVKLLDPARVLPRAWLPFDFVWLTRNPAQQARSQVKFLRMVGGVRASADAVPALAKGIMEDEATTVRMLSSYPSARLLKLTFEELLGDPASACAKLSDFCGGLDVAKMTAEVIARPTSCYPGMLEAQYDQARRAEEGQS